MNAVVMSFTHVKMNNKIVYLQVMALNYFSGNIFYDKFREYFRLWSTFSSD